MTTVEALVIGAGQAGLAMSWHLRQRGFEHVLLERARVAERWRTQRWDSLRFQFPNWSMVLPGFAAHRGAGPEAFAPCREVLHYIETYASAIDAPVRTGVEVTALTYREHHGFAVTTTQGQWHARHVVVATGPYQQPRLPALHADLPPELLQLHAGDYRNPASLPDGAVLVVGSGASGCQIADELVEAGRDVYLCVGRHRRVPRRYRGRDAFWWRRELGDLDRSIESLSGPRPRAPLVTGVHGGYDVDLRASAARGLSLLGHLEAVDGRRLRFADDLETNLDAGDRSFDEFVAAVDAHVRERGLDAPEAPPRDPSPAPRARARTWLDVDRDGIGSVIWATGYRFDFGWIALPVFDGAGAPLHRRGTTSVPGLYFLGLPWLHKAKSSFLCGVGEDAEYIAEAIAGPPA